MSSLFPPWKNSFGFPRRAFFLTPPPEVTALHWGNFFQGIIAIVIVGIVIGQIIPSRESLKRPGVRFPSFGWRTFGVAAALGLLTPIPIPGGGPSGETAVMPPLALMPLEVILDSNHGIPGVLILSPLWLLASLALFVLLVGWGIVTRAGRR